MARSLQPDRSSGGQAAAALLELPDLKQRGKEVNPNASEEEGQEGKEGEEEVTPPF